MKMYDGVGVGVALFLKLFSQGAGQCVGYYFFLQS